MKEIRKTIAVCSSFIFWASLAVLTVSSLCYTAEYSAHFQMGSMIVGSVAFAVLLLAGGIRSNEEYLEYLEQREKKRQRRNRR